MGTVEIQERIQAAGVVGAGGAGFPTHVKAGARTEIVIANGAECEPLIHKDLELMQHYAAEVTKGLQLLMEATGATRGIVGLKEKNVGATEAFRRILDDKRITIFLLGDFYPSGDEFILVYEATGRLIPPQGIPLDVGVVVNNVETLYNIARAVNGIPVTEKFVTVAGAVREPMSFIAPIGMTYREALRVAGGTGSDAHALFVGGIMMGRLESDLDLPITKTCAGLIVLPADHTLVRRMDQPIERMHRIGKSACDQCTYCTELCPRYLIGYDVQPHKVMRSLGFTKTGEDFWNQYAALCCSCGLCTLYACPENLFPKEACDASKNALKQSGVRWSGNTNVEPHPMYKGRRTPLRQLVKKLGLGEYDRPSRFESRRPQPSKVKIPLAQHVGVPGEPVVRAGQKVGAGDLIADLPPGSLGARVHASISGVVRSVDTAIVIERG